jgi:integrase/recombinase XerD
MAKSEPTYILPQRLAVSDPRQNEYLHEELHIRAWLLQKRSLETKRNYSREIRSFLGMYPELMLKHVSTAHMVAFLSKRSHLSASAQNLSKNVLSSLFRYCVKIGYLDRNPADALDSIRVPQQLAYRSLSEDEVRRLLRAAKSFKKRDYLLIKFLFMTGTRRLEAVSVRWQHFRIDENVAKLIIVGKGQKVRTLNLGLDLYEELISLKKESMHSQDYVFTSQEEPYGHLSTTQAWRIVKRAAKLAGLPARISPHFFRHAHATISLSNGVPISTLQHSLGHASLSTTGVYLDAFPTKTSGEYLPDLE